MWGWKLDCGDTDGTTSDGNGFIATVDGLADWIIRLDLVCLDTAISVDLFVECVRVDSRNDLCRLVVFALGILATLLGGLGIMPVSESLFPMRVRGCVRAIDAGAALQDDPGRFEFGAVVYPRSVWLVGNALCGRPNVLSLPSSVSTCRAFPALGHCICSAGVSIGESRL
ncbi:hypothetical protein BASA81_016820 [Batrachochytrium salamandrivorans]|nr:hypothetical protein BASA81_016820 [Batrachochytrium salamandrivorans]